MGDDTHDTRAHTHMHTKGETRKTLNREAFGALTRTPARVHTLTRNPARMHTLTGAATMRVALSMALAASTYRAMAARHKHTDAHTSQSTIPAKP